MKKKEVNLNNDNLVSFVNKVIDKKFSVSSKGYDPREVDLTLDDIFNHLSKYQEEYDALNNKNLENLAQIQKLTSQIELLRNENDDLKYKMKRLEESGAYSNLLMSLIEKEKNNEQTRNINEQNLDYINKQRKQN